MRRFFRFAGWSTLIIDLGNDNGSVGNAIISPPQNTQCNADLYAPEFTPPRQEMATQKIIGVCGLGIKSNLKRWVRGLGVGLLMKCLIYNKN